MSEYNQSQPLVMSSIKIGSYVLTEAELNKFVKLDSYRKIPSEYIGCDVRVNVYTLTEYAALQWIPHPSMGDVAIVFDPDESKACYNGTYVYQNPDIGNCIPQSPCDVPPTAETRVINIANWKLVNPTISYEDIVKWNAYTEELGIVRQDIVALRELVGVTEANINALTNNKIEIAKSEVTVNFKADDNVVREEFAAADRSLNQKIDTVEDKFDGEVNRIDQTIIDFKAKEQEDVDNLQEQISENKENIRLNARDLGDLNVKFDRTVESINTSVDQKVTLLKEEVTSKIAQHTSEIDGKLAGQKTEFTTADLALGSRITNEVSGLNDRIDSEVDTLENKIETADSTLDHKIDEEKTARISNDTTLNTRITNEVSGLNDRIDSEVETINGSITSEASARNTSDVAINSRIDSEVSTINTSINGEKSARILGDQMLDNRIASEVTTLNTRVGSEVTTLNTRITNEVSGLNDRIDSEVDTLENKIETADSNLLQTINVNKTAQETGDATLNTRITTEAAAIRSELASEVSTLNSAISSNVSTINSTINSKETALYTKIGQEVSDINHDFEQHVNDADLHVTAAKQAVWNAKIDAADLAAGLAPKADSADVYTKAVVDSKFDEVNAYIQAKAREHFQGFFASTAELPLPGQQGWYAVCGTTDTIWIWDVETSAWVDSKAKSAVTSVNDKTGVVVLTKSDVGLSLVDNTSDADKPISTATANALNGKVDKVEGKQLSDNNYSNTAVDEVAKVKNKADKSYVDGELALKADKSYVDNLLSTKFFVGVFATVESLPNDATPGQFAIVTDDDLVYVWDQGNHGWISSLDKSYTKQETETKLAVKADIAYVDSQISASIAPKADTTYVNGQLALKVDKVEGKQLSDNNYDAAAVAEVAKIADKANTTYVDSEIARVEGVINNLPSKNFIGVFATKNDLPTGVAGQFALTLTEDKLWVWDGNADTPVWVSYYLTKEIDNMLSVKATVKSVNDLAAVVDTKAAIVDVNTGLALKANIVDVDDSLATKVDITTYEADMLLKANVADVDSGLALKANITDVNAGLATKVDATTHTADLALKANVTDVTDALATKVDATTHTADLALKANVTDVNASLDLKADKSYVDTQVAMLTKFRGYFETSSEITGIDNPKNGDYAVCNATGTVWYYKVDNNNNGTWIDGDVHGEVTLEQFNTQIALKANANDVYTKLESDAKFATITKVGELEGQLNAKAVADQVYTKTAADGLFVSQTNYNAFVGQTNATLDEKANETSVATRLDTKVDKVEGKQLSDNNYDAAAVAEVAKVADKADKTYVDGELALKADKSYVDEQDGIISSDVTNLATLVGDQNAEPNVTGSVFARIAYLNGSKVNVVPGKQLSDNNYDAAAVAEVAKVTLKADKTYVDNLIGDPNSNQVDSDGDVYKRLRYLAQAKADATSVSEQLALKANNSALSAKADVSYVDNNFVKTTTANSTYATIATVGAAGDAASATGSVFARIAKLVSDLNSKADSTTVGTAADSASATGSVFARIANINNTKADASVVGTAADAADANGSLFARIAKLEQRIATLEGYHA